MFIHHHHDHRESLNWAILVLVAVCAAIAVDLAIHVTSDKYACNYNGGVEALFGACTPK
ncbi:hypothetical protein ACTJJ7_15670 [Phyllobacterium sp. 22229]|uniref:hypothetical protein n=1 Tax=Phyllobacterium sp. 22229 TaxID=3453895 RepID=UPI003F85DCA5